MQKPKRIKRPVHGVLLLDKAEGVSSNGALQQARWLYQAEKAGHTGTLDPFATGLLPLCFGEATKFAQTLLDADKTYVATVKLGERTTTGDTEGEVIASYPVSVDEAQVSAVLRQFEGEITQIPPMYSALKHEGRALYELARQGIEVERKSRKVFIYAVQLRHLTQEGFQMEVSCSKGTYIRVLAEDIGAALGCGAHLTALRRTATAGFRLEDAYTRDALEALNLAERDALLLPIDSLLADLPIFMMDEAQKRAVQQGQPLKVDSIEGRYRLYDTAGDFFGLATVDAEGRLLSQRLLNTSVF